MAEKSVFISRAEYPYFEEVHVLIDRFGGFEIPEPEAPGRMQTGDVLPAQKPAGGYSWNRQAIYPDL